MKWTTAKSQEKDEGPGREPAAEMRRSRPVEATRGSKPTEFPHSQDEDGKEKDGVKRNSYICAPAPSGNTYRKTRAWKRGNKYIALEKSRCSCGTPDWSARWRGTCKNSGKRWSLQFTIIKVVKLHWEVKRIEVTIPRSPVSKELEENGECAPMKRRAAPETGDKKKEYC